MKPKTLSKALFISGIIGFVITIIGYGIYFWSFQGNLSSKADDWASFGDFIGGTLGPLLSFLSFIAVLFTISLQATELEATREELRRAAQAQEKAEQALREQNTTQERMQFEGTFFSLLEQHNKALEKLEQSAQRLLREQSILDSINAQVFHNNFTLEQAKIELQKCNNICGSYFRLLYQILKFISVNHPKGTMQFITSETYRHTNTATPTEKIYSNIVRACMNHSITQLLAVNCYCVNDEQDSYWHYKMLVEKYAFFEHMPFKIGNNDQENGILAETREYYVFTAFGDNVHLPKNFHAPHTYQTNDNR